MNKGGRIEQFWSTIRGFEAARAAYRTSISFHERFNRERRAGEEYPCNEIQRYWHPKY